jgi:hypothetical protein
MGFRLFLGSSAVEHSTVNRMVAGSNPARGAKQIKHLAQILRAGPKSLFQFHNIAGNNRVWRYSTRTRIEAWHEKRGVG